MSVWRFGKTLTTTRKLTDTVSVSLSFVVSLRNLPISTLKEKQKRFILCLYILFILFCFLFLLLFLLLFFYLFRAAKILLFFDTITLFCVFVFFINRKGPNRCFFVSSAKSYQGHLQPECCQRALYFLECLNVEMCYCFNVGIID